MFELAEFYDFCKENNVQVIPFSGIPNPGATVRDGNNYAIFLDFNQIDSTRLLRGVCYHELGHIATGALHRASSPYESVERCEYRANRYAAERFLTEKDFRQAFQAGFVEVWQLADYFDLPERDVEKALRYWTDAKGVNFNT